MLDFFISYGYIGLFISAFLAGSVLPFSSEAVLLALLGIGLDPELLLLYASTGNVLGALLNFWIGRQGRLDWIEKYMHVKKESLEKAERFMNGHGAWIGFFSFVPILGSAITVLLGYMRANIIISLCAIILGKVIRYIIIIYGPLLAIQAIS